MKVSIYDYANNEVEVNLPVDKVENIMCICVTILSGNETVWFIFKNGNNLKVDSAGHRNWDYYDGSYIVDTPEKIKKWIEFEYDGTRTMSYARQEALDEDEEEEE